MSQRAAEAGIGEAWQFFSMTPGEISLLLAARRAREKEKLCMLWLQGRYTALAVHAPDQMPSCPDGGMLSPMTDDEMKMRLLSWRRKDETL